MALLIRGCGDGGTTLAPPSLWDSLVKLAIAAAIGRGDVRGLEPRSPCISEAVSFVRSLGFNTDTPSYDRVSVEEQEPTRARISFSFRCWNLTAYLLLPLAITMLKPGQRLVARLLTRTKDTAVRMLVEALNAMGGRAVPVHGRPRTILLEGGLRRGSPRYVFLDRASGALLSGFLIALGRITERVTISVREGRVAGQDRLADTATVLAEQGLASIKVSEELKVSIQYSPAFKAHTPHQLSVRAGVEEAAHLLTLTEGCSGERRVSDLPENAPRLRDTLLILRMLGLNADLECRGGRCTMASYGANPASIVYNVRSWVQIAPSLASHLGRLRDAVISGVSSLELEGFSLEDVVRALQSLGAEAYLEEDRLVAKETEQELERAGVSSCRGLDPLSCMPILSFFLSKLSKRDDIEVLLGGAEELDRIVPRALTALTELGVEFDVVPEGS
jgi:hypothetical protein